MRRRLHFLPFRHFLLSDRSSFGAMFLGDLALQKTAQTRPVWRRGDAPVTHAYKVGRIRKVSGVSSSSPSFHTTRNVKTRPGP